VLISAPNGKNGFVTTTKLGTTNKFLLLQPKILLQQPYLLLIELNILLLKQNIFAIPILTNDFVGITKPFIPCMKIEEILDVNNAPCWGTFLFQHY